MLEKFGHTLGEHLAKPMLSRLEKKIGEIDTTAYGIEHIQSLDPNRAALIALNHIGPVDKAGQYVDSKSGLTPDVIISRTVISDATSRTPKIVSIYSDDLLVEKLEGTIGRANSHAIQSRLKPMRKGIISGMQLIPVDKAQDRFNRDFLSKIGEAVDNHDLIIIFPEGVWRRPDHDYSKEINIEPGTAHIALKYDIPVVPAYIHCSDGWDNTDPALISFDKPIYPNGQTKEEISQMLGQSIARIQTDLNSPAK